MQVIGPEDEDAQVPPVGLVMSMQTAEPKAVGTAPAAVAQFPVVGHVTCPRLLNTTNDFAVEVIDATALGVLAALYICSK